MKMIEIGGNDGVDGKLLGYGQTTYRPPVDLTRFVIARDQVCAFPRCNQPAVRCDLDHVIRYPAGPTSPANLVALCRRHHRAKHEGGWKLVTDPDGGHIWTSPAGKT
nr:HNH endonuclease signature motif containing protein [Frankia sp. CiP3]